MATCIRSEIMIVFAGYTKEMEQFLKTNPVLKSRVPNEFDFEDYTPEEAVEIGLKYLESQQCRFNEGNRRYHRQHQEAVQADSGSHQVNDGSLKRNKGLVENVSDVAEVSDRIEEVSANSEEVLITMDEFTQYVSNLRDIPSHLKSETDKLKVEG